MDFLNKILKIVRPNSQYHFKFRLQIFILFINRFLKEILNSRIEKTSESVDKKSQNNENDLYKIWKNIDQMIKF